MPSFYNPNHDIAEYNDSFDCYSETEETRFCYQSGAEYPESEIVWDDDFAHYVAKENIDDYVEGIQDLTEVEKQKLKTKLKQL